MKKNCKKLKARLREADLMREKMRDEIKARRVEKAVNKRKAKEETKMQDEDNTTDQPQEKVEKMEFDEVEYQGNSRGKKKMRRSSNDD